ARARHLARAREALDGREQLLALLARHGRIAGCERLGHTVRDVVLEHLRGDTLERRLDRGDLREHVDAVPVLLDHPLDAAHLALDPVQTLRERLLVLGVAVHQMTSRIECRSGSVSVCFTTRPLESAIAAAATTGLRRPAIASGIAMAGLLSPVVA